MTIGYAELKFSVKIHDNLWQIRGNSCLQKITLSASSVFSVF